MKETQKFSRSKNQGNKRNLDGNQSNEGTDEFDKGLALGRCLRSVKKINQ